MRPKTGAKNLKCLYAGEGPLCVLPLQFSCRLLCATKRLARLSVQFYATRFTQQTSFDNFRSDAQRAEKQKQAKERELEHAAFSADRIEEGGFPPVSMVSFSPF